MKNNTSGFTLIELLVVVLIIGILSSVALPQYQKAVEKSRATEVMMYVDAYIKAQQLYHMANGTFAEYSKWGDLDISLPETLKYFDISGTCSSSICITNFSSKNSNFGYKLTLGMNFSNGTFIINTRACQSNGSSGEAICKALSNGATCSNWGGDGDVPWCYKAS